MGEDRGRPYGGAADTPRRVRELVATARELLLEVTTSTLASFVDLVGEFD